MPKLGIGVIGSGFMAQAVHIPSIIRTERASVVAISDLKVKLASSVAARWQIPKVYADYQDMLRSDEVQAVFVLTDKYSHYQVVMDALVAGKHVFVEKPLAMRYSDALKIAQEANRRNLVTFVGYMKRYDAGMNLAKEKILSFGKPSFARATYFGGNWTFGEPQIKPLTSDETVPQSQKSYPEIPPQAIRLYDDLVEQIHVINSVRYLFGEPKVLSSNLKAGFLCSSLDAGHLISLEFGSVNLGGWKEEYLALYRDSEILVRPPPPLYRNTTASVYINQGGIETNYPRVGFKWAFEAEVEAFLAAVIDGEPYVSGAEDSANDLKIAEDIAREAAQASSF